jgi:hypothetical protein
MLAQIVQRRFADERQNLVDSILALPSIRFL